MECSLLADRWAHTKDKKWFLTIAGTLFCQEWWLSSEHCCGWWKLVSSLRSGNDTTEHGIASQNHPCKSQKQFRVPVGPWELYYWIKGGTYWLSFAMKGNHQCCLQPSGPSGALLCTVLQMFRKEKDNTATQQHMVTHCCVWSWFGGTADTFSLSTLQSLPRPHHLPLVQLIKDQMWDQYYGTNEAVQEAIHCCLWFAKTEFYYNEIFKFLGQWQKCVESDGDFEYSAQFWMTWCFLIRTFTQLWNRFNHDFWYSPCKFTFRWLIILCNNWYWRILLTI